MNRGLASLARLMINCRMEPAVAKGVHAIKRRHTRPSHHPVKSGSACTYKCGHHDAPLYHDARGQDAAFATAQRCTTTYVLVSIVLLLFLAPFVTPPARGFTLRIYLRRCAVACIPLLRSALPHAFSALRTTSLPLTRQTCSAYEIIMRYLTSSIVAAVCTPPPLPPPPLPLPSLLPLPSINQCHRRACGRVPAQSTTQAATAREHGRALCKLPRE